MLPSLARKHARQGIWLFDDFSGSRILLGGAIDLMDDAVLNGKCFFAMCVEDDLRLQTSTIIRELGL